MPHPVIPDDARTLAFYLLTALAQSEFHDSLTATGSVADAEFLGQRIASVILQQFEAVYESMSGRLTLTCGPEARSVAAVLKRTESQGG